APSPVQAPPAPPAPPAPRTAAKPAIANVGECAPKGEDYPSAALRAEVTGTTTIEFTVGPDGRMTDARVVQPSGMSREHRALDRVALNKLSECKFKPGADESGRS
ncbi:energy transducer TonB, partial [Arthrospira platensis SPKY1]|nr:energy transducer TonB [Arthrospira platensis SPKY1]